MIQKTILLLEDDVLNRKLCQIQLSKMGHISYVAKNGEEAVKLYKFLLAAESPQIDTSNVEYKGPVDIMISDINLGAGINGIETVRQIEEIKLIPVIFWSAQDREDIEHQLRGVEYPYWIMVKPTSMETCVSTLEQAIAWQEKQK